MGCAHLDSAERRAAVVEKHLHHLRRHHVTSAMP
jgi:hypothetical protein